MKNFKDCFHYCIPSIGLLILGYYFPIMLNCKYEQVWDELSQYGFINRIIILTIESGLFYMVLGLIMFLFGTYRTVIKYNNNIKKLESKCKKEKEDFESELRNTINVYQEQIADLNREIYSLNQNAPDIWLKMLFEKFEFATDVRVSIYFMHEDSFHLLSRHSDNPNFKETHNPEHNKNEGILSKVWSDKIAEESECPHSKDIKKYIQYVVSKYNYDENRVKDMKMKSCRYLGVRIDHNRDGIGMILVESLDENLFDKNKSDDIMSYISSSSSYLTKFILTGKEYQKKKLILTSIKEKDTPEQNMKDLILKGKNNNNE